MLLEMSRRAQSRAWAQGRFVWAMVSPDGGMFRIFWGVNSTDAERRGRAYMRQNTRPIIRSRRACGNHHGT